MCDKRIHSSSNKAEIGRNVMCMVYNTHMVKFHSQHGLQVESHVERPQASEWKEKKKSFSIPAVPTTFMESEKRIYPGVREAS